MNLIAERNEKGEVKLAGGTKMQIPTTMSMLNVFNDHNPIIDGADYRDDYWVYVNGERVKKWFVSGHGFKALWPPNLAPKNLAKLESLWHRLSQRSFAVWKKTWALAQEIDKKGAPKNKYGDAVIHVPGTKDNDGAYWSFTVNKAGLGFGWHKPSGKIRFPRLGSKLERMYRYQQQVYRRAGKVESAFTRAAIELVSRKCCAMVKPHASRLVRLNINGREYTYRLYKNSEPSVHVEPITVVEPVIDIVA